MDCKHERVRCTDGIFYCLKCGQRIDYPPMNEGEEKPAETAKKGVKRKKKEGK